MSEVNRLSPETHAQVDEMVQVAKEAIREAQEESRRMGVPNVYGIDGKIYYELPSGELSLIDPYPATRPNP